MHKSSRVVTRFCCCQLLVVGSLFVAGLVVLGVYSLNAASYVKTEGDSNGISGLRKCPVQDLEASIAEDHSDGAVILKSEEEIGFSSIAFTCLPLHIFGIH